MVCRYIQQQKERGKKNADFPIGEQYKDDIGSIAQEVVKQSRVSFRIMSISGLLYICRTEWDAPTVKVVKKKQAVIPAAVKIKKQPVTPSPAPMTSIYVLRLEGGRYYVGKSTNVLKRYEEHVDGHGSAWTRRYPPILLEKTIHNAGPFDEDKVTKEYMAKHGIDRVRGGSYVSEVLDAVQIDALQREIRGATDACTRCGSKGHFVRDCRAPSAAAGVPSAATRASSASAATCYTCGRPGHYASSCYARTTIDGEELESDSGSDYDSDSDY